MSYDQTGAWGDRALGPTDGALLEAFVIDNADLERLEHLLSDYNLFEAAGLARQETRHSYFLASLLNPAGEHGLGEEFLGRFLRKIVGRAGDSAPVAPLDLALWNLGDTEIRREWRGIDILVLDRTHRLAVILENKIDSGEHSDQLARYLEEVGRACPGFDVVPVFLTPDGRRPTEDAYYSASYSIISEVIEEILQRRSTGMGDEVAMILRHYANLIKRHIMPESDIAELCRLIYKKHQRALDLIYEHRPDLQAELFERLVAMVKAEPMARLDHSTKSAIRFSVSPWEIPALRTGEGWTSTRRILLFEFTNSPTVLKLSLYLGPGPQGTRQVIYAQAVASSFLKPRGKKLAAKWQTLYSRTWVSPDALNETLAAEELDEILGGRWGDFLEDELPSVVASLEPAIEQLADGRT